MYNHPDCYFKRETRISKKFKILISLLYETFCLIMKIIFEQKIYHE